jgi:hypothetical protein
MKKTILILVAVILGITACNETAELNDKSKNLDFQSSTAVFGVMQNGMPIVTVPFAGFDSVLNAEALTAGFQEAKLIGHSIIDEGAYGYSYLFTYEVVEAPGDTVSATGSVPIDLVGNNFILYGGEREKVLCKSRNCIGCTPVQGNCTTCLAYEDDGYCEKIIESGGGGGGGGAWVPFWTAVISGLFGFLSTL